MKYIGFLEGHHVYSIYKILKWMVKKGFTAVLAGIPVVNGQAKVVNDDKLGNMALDNCLFVRHPASLLVINQSPHARTHTQCCHVCRLMLLTSDRCVIHFFRI